MILRAAVSGDAAAIAALWAPWIRDTAITFTSVEKSEADVVAMINDRAARGQAFLVATLGDVLLGFATYAQFRSGPGYAHTMEHSILLAEAATGQGVGRGLMQALEDHARRTGHHVMIAGVSSGNPGGIAFHRRLGYGETAVLQQAGRKFGQWCDLHLMQKRL